MPVQVVHEPQEGPQTDFLNSDADIVVYGGEAGGGKTYGLLLEAAAGFEDPDFGAVIFRRTSPQITAEGGLWDTAGELFPLIGGKMMDGVREVRFKSGARIQFRHLQHESDKYDWQGSQVPLICFDELTHFTSGQFWYLLSRNRAVSSIDDDPDSGRVVPLKPYVRCTTNPEAGSWVYELIKWWIDPDSGYADPEKSGIVRWFVKHDEEVHWADTEEKLAEQFDDAEPKSLTFIHASLDDNPALVEKDPGYKANIEAQGRVERERLKGNWFASENSQIDASWLKHTFAVIHDAAGKEKIQFTRGGSVKESFANKGRRFATIDTAGTSKQKADELKGKAASWSCCGIWDYFSQYDALCLRYVWRKRVNWGGLREGVNETLAHWGCKKAYVENAHFGPALAEDIRGCTTELIGPKIAGMRDRNPSAKLERATASKLLSRLEHGNFYLPIDSPNWLAPYRQELVSWQGLQEETANQIDISSYGAYVAKKGSSSWGGHVVPQHTATGLRR